MGFCFCRKPVETKLGPCFRHWTRQPDQAALAGRPRQAPPSAPEMHSMNSMPLSSTSSICLRAEHFQRRPQIGSLDPGRLELLAAWAFTTSQKPMPSLCLSQELFSCPLELCCHGPWTDELTQVKLYLGFCAEVQLEKVEMRPLHHRDQLRRHGSPARISMYEEGSGRDCRNPASAT